MRFIFNTPVVIIMMVLSLFFYPYEKKTDEIVKVEYRDLEKNQQKQVDCLAQNIYHEARSESETGQQAVAFVTINRTQDRRFPKDICAVVKQKNSSVCQFSWSCAQVNTDRTSDSFKEALQTALYVYTNYERIYDVTRGALFYHADYIKPGWKNLEPTAKIGRHIFYNYKEGTRYDAKIKSSAI